MKVFNLAEELEKERKKNKELQERIDKAIERIEKGIFIIPTDTDELIKILKGDNK